MVIISNLDKREYIPISNNYEVINESNDDFHLVIYYLDHNKIKIIIRRLDSITGWGVDLKIKIYSINSDEIIPLGSSENNSKIIDVYTNIKIFKENFGNQLIPKLIIQTSFSKNIENLLHYNSILTYIELNPEYEYIFYDNNECRLFIKKNFNEIVLNSYDLIIPGAFKADFFRYCFLYINGGCYFDCKSILRIPLRKIIKYNDEFIICEDIGGKGYYNAVILTVKENKLMLDAINLCVYNIYNINNFYNIKNHIYRLTETMLSFTGPVLLYNAIHNNVSKNNVKLYHRFENIKYNEYIIKHEYQKLFIEMNGEYIITKQYRNYHSSCGIHYSEQWNKKELVYRYFSKLYTNKYKFYVYNKTNDIFEFYILNNNIMIIERKDSNSGWGIGFKLKIVNEETNEDLILNIDSSICNFKKIYIQENFFKEDILIKSFYVNNIDDFLLHITDDGSNKKLIIFNNHRKSWKDLNIDLILNNKKYNIDISDSELPLKIIDIDI